jgi:hypothetical protein
MSEGKISDDFNVGKTDKPKLMMSFITPKIKKQQSNIIIVKDDSNLYQTLFKNNNDSPINNKSSARKNKSVKRYSEINSS